MKTYRVAKNMARTIRQLANYVETSIDFEDLCYNLHELVNEATIMEDEAQILWTKQLEE